MSYLKVRRSVGDILTPTVCSLFRYTSLIEMTNAASDVSETIPNAGSVAAFSEIPISQKSSQFWEPSPNICTAGLQGWY
jgi:hypothetical protein